MSMMEEIYKQLLALLLHSDPHHLLMTFSESLVDDNKLVELST